MQNQTTRRTFLQAAGLGAALAASVITAAVADEEPKRGGALTYMIPADGPPSFDGHREATYATVHSAAPYYSLLIRVNPDIEKIFIVTEKMSVHDAREIRAMAQHNGIDVFGANSLGVADAWNRVRIGGALGGDNPAETLKQGSIAIYSNSGNFGSTIATYLRRTSFSAATESRRLQTSGWLR